MQELNNNNNNNNNNNKTYKRAGSKHKCQWQRQHRYKNTTQ